MLLPTIDFETYSEAGFTYDAKTGKWLKLGPKGGIADVGAWAYSRHPSTEVLWLSYDMRDGRGVQSWFPWCEPPADLFDYVRNGGVVEAHNSFFEYGIWNNVFTRQCGAPPAPIGQFYDTAAACSAWGLPRSLEDAAKVLGVTQQKDTATARQVKKLWMPRKATKNNPRLRYTLEHDTELHMMNGSYCEQDVRTEIDVSLAVPALSEYEHRVWQLDQQINARGVHIDRPALNDAIEIIRQMREKYIPMQQVLTGGAVKSPNSYAALRQWVCDQGIEIPDTQATTIEETLERDDLPDVVRQVLDIQVLAGGAAIKKIYAMDRFADLEDNRIRGVFSYYGAVATGRWASRGCQMHNFSNSGPDNWECSGCGEHYGTQHQTCPYCHADVVPCRKCDRPVSRAAGACGCGKKPEADEWGAEAAESVIRLMRHRSLDHMETVWGNAQKAITSCTRGMITAGPGHDLLCSDYSAIEARVLACLAGEDWRIDVFRTHGKIYEASAAAMFKMDLAEFSTYKAENGAHHPARKKGKVAELACLHPHTLVLTDSGYVRLADIKARHRLWDGEQWVNHQGVVLKGRKEVIDVDGVLMTKEHLVISNNSWKEAKQLVSSPNILMSALATGSENLPWSNKPETLQKKKGMSCNVRAVATLISSLLRTCSWGRPRDVGSALERKLRKLGKNIITNTLSFVRTTSTEDVSSIACERPSQGVTLRIVRLIKTMAKEASSFAMNGEKNSGRELFLNTSLLCMGGTILTSRWTGSTSTGGMNPATSDSSRRARTLKTSDVLEPCKKESKNWSDVYDIAFAGPRNRFTIKSNSGHLIVHNCGYGGGPGAMKAFGADKFMTEKEIADNVRDWRAASPAVVTLWRGLEEAAINAIRNPGQCYRYRHIAYQLNPADGVLYCQLPSGRLLTYHGAWLTSVYVRWEESGQLIQDPGTGLMVPERVRCDYPYPVDGGKPQDVINHMGTPRKGGGGTWVRCKTWGGTLCENVCQAVSRDLLADAMLRLDAAGYPIVMHVHDEIIAEVPHGFGSVEEFERIMGTPPAWAADWPIKAADGWRGLRYRK